MRLSLADSLANRIRYMATGHADLTYEWLRGTGRFEGVRGGTTIWLIELFDGTYDSVADGVINY